LGGAALTTAQKEQVLEIVGRRAEQNYQYGTGWVTMGAHVASRHMEEIVTLQQHAQFVRL
jgi:hypothetical protein